MYIYIYIHIYKDIITMSICITNISVSSICAKIFVCTHIILSWNMDLDPEALSLEHV